MTFTLHPRLAAGTMELGRLHGCRVLLKMNALFPWLILVPEVDDEIEDLHQLEHARYAEVTLAMRETSQFIAHYFRPEKINLACIGNQVRQMHVHIVGRSKGDAAWPGVVWGFSEKANYSDYDIAVICDAWERRADYD